MEKIVWHKHHLVPQHIGGTNDSSNIIKVNIPLHALLHKLLWEKHGRWQDNVAWRGLSGQITSAEAIKLTQRNYMTNRVVSEETRRKISQASSGRKWTEKSREKRIESMKGRIVSEETRKKISETNKGKHYRENVVFSEVHRKNLSQSKKGHKAGMTNRKHSLETLEKMRLARTTYWEKKNAIK